MILDLSLWSDDKSKIITQQSKELVVILNPGLGGSPATESPRSSFERSR